MSSSVCVGERLAALIVTLPSKKEVVDYAERLDDEGGDAMVDLLAAAHASLDARLSYVVMAMARMNIIGQEIAKKKGRRSGPGAR